MLNLIMKLPNFILLWLSGKKQITIGNRSLLPAFQLICIQNEKLGLDLSQLSNNYLAYLLKFYIDSN